MAGCRTLTPGRSRSSCRCRLAVWWRDYAGPTMRTLFDEKDPFHGCTPRAHSPKGMPLPFDPPQVGFFE
ncbi:DUF4913 domain-containing protein [Kocuria sp. CPCC 205258]|uniref:DUF4913 domain-containing protein n=1 Tax=Kocuria sp. CPCC 205258 TaxID=3073552 RepID=UPI0034D61434